MSVVKSHNETNFINYYSNETTRHRVIITDNIKDGLI